MDKVVFLDRDGTLNEEIHYLHKPEDLHLLPGVREGLSLLKHHGFKLVVVTNQAGVARGYYSEADVEALHQHLNGMLKAESLLTCVAGKENAGTEIDHYFYCPHHPVHGLGKYKRECRCRKPETGMFEMAEEFFLVDKNHSYMIGDKFLDTEAGRRYGVTSILVGTGYGKELKENLEENQCSKYYDHYAENFMDAANWITKREGECKNE